MSHHILAICFDSGDTIIDEGTEIKNDAGVTLQVDLIPGAADLLHELKRRGYKLALVSDGPGGKEKISIDGATAHPVWSRDGRELFYCNGSKMMAVSIDGEQRLMAGKPRLLFEGQYKSRVLFPLQIILRDILIQNTFVDEMNLDDENAIAQMMLAEQIKYGMIIVASVPVLILYPFVQRHYVRGVMIGAIKG